jgi:phosphoribosyl 1,2-cyclic phosphate phosphodiesterase
MELLFLGTGTSVGVPMIGCDCAVCRSADPRNRRRRTSLHVQAGGAHAIVDTPPDFREQALANDLRRLDALLFTHAHADHIFGLDDVRRFNTIQGNMAVPVYASPETLRELRRVYTYVGRVHRPGLYRPLVEFRAIAGPFQVLPLDAARSGGAGLRVVPFDVVHGGDRTLGFRIEADGRAVGYVPDCQALPESAVDALRGVDVMVLDALRYTPHPTHLTVTESLSLLRRIGAGRSYLIHLGHELDHHELEKTLPATVSVSYDGLRVSV